jgi:hypothetical protein
MVNRRRLIMSKKQFFGYLLIMICCLAVSIPVFAGVTGKIAGRVIDTQTGEALVGANIMIEGTRLGSAADVNGDYFILNIPPGKYNVVASMIGYTKVSKTEVIVNIDLTTKVDFSLATTVLEGSVVTIVAGREVVKKDVSASLMSSTAEEIAAVPMVKDVAAFLNLQSGIEARQDADGNEQILIRGGGMDQVGMVVDGLPMVDNVHNRPMNIVNLSAIQEVSIIKGGFNAEYGNIRSGLFNIVTKEGSDKYHFGVDFRYTPAQLKHRGASLFETNNFYLRPYLDPQVCWVGTNNGMWDQYTRQQYDEFMGWDAFSKNLAADADPTNDLTPQQCRDVFIWQHRAEGSKALGNPHPGEYGNKPDVNLDLNLGGPVPLIGKYLGDLSFNASFRNVVEQYALPTSIDAIRQQNSQIKLTSRLSNTMKLGFEAMYGDELNAGESPYNWGRTGRTVYFVHDIVPMNIYRSMVGLTFDHVISTRTFYNVRISKIQVQNNQYGERVFRDPKILRTIGNIQLDERPWGYWPHAGYQYSLADEMVLGGAGGGSRDLTDVNTMNVKADLTSQVNKYNQVKTGFEFIYDDNNYYVADQGLDPTGNHVEKWKKAPIRIGAYAEDKLEFEGMIANVGLRMDYNDPNTSWYTVDRYSQYFSRVYKSQFTQKTPQTAANSHVKLSPRVGISHPISDVSKLFFNYGHFYSMPYANTMYNINFGAGPEGISEIGNPSLNPPRTIAYELGYEHEIAQMYLIRLTGYYKDITDQPASIRYINYDETVNYSTFQNNDYADVRGFELEIRKDFGEWVTGWLNYNYMVETHGIVGREINYQDPRKQAVYGLRNPIQEKPLPQPYARANIQVRTPVKWGPMVGGVHPLEDLSVALLCQYRSGDYLTWEPKPPFTLQNNLQWKSQWNFDARIYKTVSIGNYEVSLFADILNIFDLKYLTGRGFENENDFRDYVNSLHLPMYNGDKYKNDPTFKSGHDKVGDVRSKDKPYINMPNMDFIAWNLPRSITLGLKFNF